MKANVSIVLDEEKAVYMGGHYGVTIGFDDEPKDVIIAKALEAVRALRARNLGGEA